MKKLMIAAFAAVVMTSGAMAATECDGALIPVGPQDGALFNQKVFYCFSNSENSFVLVNDIMYKDEKMKESAMKIIDAYQTDEVKQAIAHIKKEIK